MTHAPFSSADPRKQIPFRKRGSEASSHHEREWQHELPRAHRAWNPPCLQCHGTPNQDIAPETLAAIQKLYPDDKATGFKLGDLRGLWRVTFLNQK